MLDTTLIYNSVPRLIEGPTIKGKVCRFSPGNNEVPSWYVEGCKQHKQGSRLFASPRPGMAPMLRELRPTETPPEPPAAALDVTTNPQDSVPLPATLEGLELSEAMSLAASCEDTDQLLAWGQEDEREELQTLIIERLKELNYGL